MSKSKLDIISLVLGKELAGGGGVSVDSLEITSYPDTTTYMVGDELDLKGLVVYAEVGSLSGDVTNDCTFTPANGEIITADTTKVTVKYGNQKVDIPLTVRVPTAITISSQPTKTSYFIGDTVDLTGVSVTATYTELRGTTDVTEKCTFTPADGDVLDSTSITGIDVSFAGLSATIPITVYAFESIDITTQPTKTSYLVGDTLDLTGIVVKAYANSGAIEKIITDSCTFSPEDGSTLSSEGQITITATMGDLTDTTTVGVYELESIAVTTAPTKITFKTGDTLDLSGIVITGYANNGELSSDVTDGCTFNPDNGYVITEGTGSLTVDVTYGSLTTAFNVTIANDPLNTYDDMLGLIKDYYNFPVNTHGNVAITINGVSLPCDIYRVADGTVLTNSVFSKCTAVDANTQIIVGKNLSVASGTTLTPPYRCKGIIIGDVGTFTNAGTISMTARGASGAGKNIQLTSAYKISAVGGAGGARPTGAHAVRFNHGSAPASGVLSCGGGGSGARYANSDAGVTGAGGAGTSFSGGAGGGASCAYSNGYTNSTDGSSTGGAGGNGNCVRSDETASGGAGNPTGSLYGDNASYEAATDGTGGLIVICANNVISTGTLISQGRSARKLRNKQYPNGMPGGGSGGGCIVIISSERSISGTQSVAGGAGQVYFRGSDSSPAGTGASGGAGKYASYTVENLFS